MTDVASDASDLASQVQLLLDERDITRLLLALPRTVDQKDFQALASLYAVDGVLITPGGSHRGRAGLAEYVTNDLGRYQAMHHVGAGHEIDVHPDRQTATARMTLHATHVSDSATMAFNTVGGFYDIQLVREDGDWRLKQVHIHPAWRFDHPGQDKA